MLFDPLFTQSLIPSFKGPVVAGFEFSALQECYFCTHKYFIVKCLLSCMVVGGILFLYCCDTFVISISCTCSVEVKKERISIFDTGPGMDATEENSIVKWYVIRALLIIFLCSEESFK